MYCTLWSSVSLDLLPSMPFNEAVPAMDFTCIFCQALRRFIVSALGRWISTDRGGFHSRSRGEMHGYKFYHIFWPWWCFQNCFFNQIAPKNWISKAGLKMKHFLAGLRGSHPKALVLSRWNVDHHEWITQFCYFFSCTSGRVSWGVGCIFFLGKPLRFREDLIIASQGFSGRQQIWKRCWKNMNKLFFSWFNYCRSRPLKTEMEPENHHFP